MQTKLKICSVCGKESILWKSNPKMCKDCVGKAKVIEQGGNGIAQVSEARKDENKIYLTLRKVFLENHPKCEGKILGCLNRSTEVHHKRGRVGKNYLDVHTFLALCNNCHRWIETHPDWAKQQGYSLDRL